MTQQLAHRGPDSSGQWIDSSVTVGLGHTRLSIVDLSPSGCQPMTSPSERFICALNGEFYNHRQLRRELQRDGVRFRSESDTEVALAAFDRWGIAAGVTKLVGMFAMAVWDRQAHALHLLRDRIGEKPLYFGRLRRTVVFASELKSLRTHPDWKGEVDLSALGEFLRLGYVPDGRCIYRGVRKAPPGAIVTFHRPDQEPTTSTYWSGAEVAQAGLANPFPGDEAEAIEALRLQLTAAVRDQMVADVPLGAFLSGGIDSSLVVALMQSQATQAVRTFTIGFEVKEFDEAAHARAVASHLGTRHTEFRVTSAEAREVIPKLPVLYDEPFADSSQIPTHLISVLARNHVTVSLSGDGGDELFGGYGRYTELSERWRTIARVPYAMRRSIAAGLGRVPPRAWDRLATSSLRRLALFRRVDPAADRIGRLSDVLAAGTHDEVYDAILSHWRREDGVMRVGAQVLRPAALPVNGMTIVERMMLRDMLDYLPSDILVKVDRAAMGVGLETRAPFLDHRVVELAWRLPMHLKIRGRVGKWILRALLGQYVPPALFDRPKMGFGVPLAEWLRGPLLDWADDLLSTPRLEREGFFSTNVIAERWQQHRSGARNWQYQLWDVLMFEAWLASHDIPVTMH